MRSVGKRAIGDLIKSSLVLVVLSEPVVAESPISVHGSAQGWLWTDEGSHASPEGATNVAALVIEDEAESSSSPFLFRRAEVRVGYGVSDSFRLEVSGDPSQAVTFGPNGKDAQLKAAIGDVLAEVKLSDRWSVWAGQAAMPVTVDGPIGPEKLWFAERSEVGHTFGEDADIGAWLVSAGDETTVTTGLYVGAGPNTFEFQQDPIGVVRIETVTTLGVLGTSTKVTLSDTPEIISGVDFQWSKSNWSVMSELYGKADNNSSDAAYQAGAYVATQYAVAGWAGALRMEWLDYDLQHSRFLARVSTCLRRNLVDSVGMLLHVSATHNPDRITDEQLNGQDLVAIVAAQLAM